jgi:hypothetical protein
MLDKEVQEEIIQYLNNIKFGNIRIELNETFPHVDIIAEKRKRFMKKIRRKKIYKKNTFHED